MLEVYKLNNILEWKIPNQDDFHNIVSYVGIRYADIHSSVLEHFGENGWYILGIFAFFIVIIFAIYVKSIIDTFRAGHEEMADENAQPNGLFYSIEENPVQYIANDNDDDSNYTDSINNTDNNFETDDETIDNEVENKKVLRSSAEDIEKELSLSLLKFSQENINQEEHEKLSNDIKKRIKIHADVENSRLKELQLYLKNKPATDKITPEPKDVVHDNIIRIIINLLGRGVSVAKINQSLYFHYQKSYAVHDIIHTVQSVCNFIGLCNAGKFDYLPQRQMLPENDAALYAWANDDNSLALILLQSFLNQLMEQSQEESGIIKEMTYALASNCACIMGDIAKLKDIDLAHNSFELATELSPKNVVAWCRLGDMYIENDAVEKAMICYQNVIDIADIYMYASELAHAKQQLAAYYKKQEVYTKSEQLQNDSKKYYDDSGIYAELTEKEIIAYNVIVDSSAQNLHQYIYKLLNSYHF